MNSTTSKSKINQHHLFFMLILLTLLSFNGMAKSKDNQHNNQHNSQHNNQHNNQSNNQNSKDKITEQNYRVRLFFGLSLPDGGGVSIKQWNTFETQVLAKTFYDGFNLVDSLGYYQGQPERSKIVTVIVTEKDMSKVKKVARQYATQFNQDSVMMVKVKVDDWQFIGKIVKN